MARLANPLGKAKIHSFSCPDNDENTKFFSDLREEARSLYMSESQLILQILKTHKQKIINNN